MTHKRTGAIAILLSFLIVVSSALPAFAATQEGNGGAAYSGPATNTFAAGMPLAEIYFDRSRFTGDPDEVTITDNTSNALSLSGKVMRIKGSALTHNTVDNNITGTYQSTYKKAAVLPDGTNKDVIVTFDIGRVLTARSGSADADMPENIVIHNNTHTQPGVNTATATSETVAAEAFFGVAVEQNITITVDGNGEFVVPFFGFNQNRNNASSYEAFRVAHGTVGYDAAIETATVPDTNVFYPTTNDSYITIEGGNFVQHGGTAAQYDPPNKVGGSTGGDEDGYRSGFATIGKSGFKVTTNAPCSENDKGSYPNNQFIALGDLTHRIWSGSGPHGSIATDKKGDTTGAELSGGTFTGAVPSGMPAVNTDAQQLMRHVIPDAKKGVTYTMKPDKGYTLDEIVVDGNSLQVPEEPSPGETWTLASADGDGTLTYIGGGKFTYSFDQANTQDHEIYVTWKKETSDIEVTKKWADASKAVAANVKLVSSAGFDEVKPIPTSDGLVYKWTRMPVYNYDESTGDAIDAITYTLSEDPDPVSSDYLNASWDGADKEGGTPVGGFTLTDPSKGNKIRETDDWYKATVTNILKNPPKGKDATSKNGKGETQKGTPTFEKGGADIPSSGAFTLLDENGSPVDSVTIPGEGKYTINKDTGEVTFEPEPDFFGTGTGVTVQVTDALGLTATAKYTPTVVDTDPDPDEDPDEDGEDSEDSSYEKPDKTRIHDVRTGDEARLLGLLLTLIEAALALSSLVWFRRKRN